MYLTTYFSQGRIEEQADPISASAPRKEWFMNDYKTFMANVMAGLVSSAIWFVIVNVISSILL